MRRALALFTLAIAGQVCALLLIDVRPYATFQHYVSWPTMLNDPPPAAWGVLAQVVIVGALAWRWRTRLAGLVTGAIPARAALWVIAGTLASVAVPAVSVAHAAGELLLAAAISVTAALTLSLGALLIPERTLARAASWVDARLTLRSSETSERPWDRRLPLVIAAWVTLAAAVASVLVLERLPHIDDSVSNLFQAKYFSTGRLYLPAPPDAESFRMDLTIVRDGKWFGYAFPGWPAVLAIGVLAGMPWLVNPVLGGVLILIGHAWLRRRLGLAMANLTILLLIPSPWLIFMSAEMMNHPLTAVLVIGALQAFDRATQDAAGVRWAVLAGLATGGAMLTRTFDAMLLVCALGCLALVDRTIVRSWRTIAIAGLTAVAIGSLSLAYNQTVTGRATYPAHEAWADARYGPGVDVIGFGPNVGIDRWPNLDPLPGHGPADVVLNLNKNLFMTNGDLFGWTVGSLVFVWLAIGIGRWSRREAPLLILPAIFAAGYSLFWFSGGPDLGARYWYPLLVPFAALTARGILSVAARIDQRGAFTHAGCRIAAAVLVATIGALAITLPWRALTKYYRYRGISGEVRELTASAGIQDALVFVRVAERADYQSAFALNPRTLEEPGTIYALDVGPAYRAGLLDHYGQRPVWVIGRAAPDAAGAKPWVVLERPAPK
jgi:hypothetical protein